MSNEAIRVRFERSGLHVPVDHASPDGITMFGELAAWPRRTMVTLRPVNQATRAKLELVIMRLGTFELAVAENAGEVLLTGKANADGSPNENLPSGFWDFTTNVYPFGNHRETGVHIPQHGELLVRVPLGREPGRIDVEPSDRWDGEIARVLEASELDRHPEEEWRRETGVEWALNTDRWARRRACALNILAVCRELQLIERVRLIFLAEVDRVHTRVDPEFVSLLDQERFHSEGEPDHPIHWRILDALEVPDKDAWELRSFRQKRHPSMQVVVARERQPTGGDPPHFAELDIDRANPRLDLYGFFTHLAEVAHPGRTNHIHLHDDLLGTGAGAFLAYTPVSA